MKRVLEVDMLIQLLLPAISLLAAMFSGTFWLAIGFAALGAWQLISAFFHLVYRLREHHIEGRVIHLLLSVLFLLLAYNNLLLPVTFLVALALAIYYFLICRREWKARKFRQLIHLK